MHGPGVIIGRHPRRRPPQDDVEHVFEFDNRGVEVGVTLAHPHGQIHACPFVPPVAAREFQEIAVDLGE